MDTNLESALATVIGAMPVEAREQQVQERILNLAASGTALVIDLGVEGLPDERRAETEEQIVRIASEIERLQGISFDALKGEA